MNIGLPTEKWFRWLRQSPTVIGLLCLLAASFWGNYARIDLFFNINFIFGSIAVWIVACLYGVFWGTLAGFLGGICTYIIWLHPYAIIIYTCEALFVSYCFHRDRRTQNIVLLDGVYWFLLGMPLVWLFYVGVMKLDPSQGWIILCKQAVNGILNALIASLILTHLPIDRWLNRPRVLSTLSLQQTLFNLLVSFVFFPCFILIILGSSQSFADIQNKAQIVLNQSTHHLASQIESWDQRRRNMLAELANINRLESSPVSQTEIAATLRFAQRSFPDLDRIAILDNQQVPLVAFPPSLKLAPLGLLPLGNQPSLSNVQLSAETNPQPKVWLTVPWQEKENVQGHVVAEFQLSRLKSLLTTYDQPFTLQATLVDRQQTVIASTKPEIRPLQVYNPQKTGEVRSVTSKIYHWFPTDGSPIFMSRWSRSYFVREVPLDPQQHWKLIVELSATPFARSLEWVQTRNLAILLLIALISPLFAAWVSRELIHPLTRLAQVTTNLPNKLLDQRSIAWPNSAITEFNSLVQNFQTMAITLNQKFWEIKTSNEQLEKRVEERTEELLNINRELAAEILERQRTQEQLQAYTRKLEQSNRELEDFAFVASHDLQEPLRKVQAFGDRLKRKYSTALSEEGLDYLERMQKAAQRMQILIADLLAFSRITTRGQPFITTDLNQILQEVLSDLEVTLQRTQAQVVASSLPILEADPLQMRQLLQNLLSNALKFQPPGQIPQITIQSRLIGPHGGQCQVKLTIQDNGIGFDPKYGDRIFTMFQRLHGRNEYEGTGVGLAICRKIVDRHNGTITAESELNAGATFIIFLPQTQGMERILDTSAQEDHP